MWCFDLDRDIQVAVRAAVDARLAFARQADLRAVIHPAGMETVLAPRALAPAAPLAGMAGRGDRLARAVAGRAGGHLHHRAQDGLAHLAHFARAVAGGAAHGRGARLGAGAVAGGADLIAGDLDLFLDPKDGFFEGQIQAILQVGAAPRRIARPAAGAPKPAKAEQVAEDIGKIAEIDGEIRRSARAFHPGMTKAVVGRPPFGIGEHGVGFVDLFEALFRIRRFVDIGMVLARQAAEGRFEIISLALRSEHPGFRNNRAVS